MSLETPAAVESNLSWGMIVVTLLPTTFAPFASAMATRTRRTPGPGRSPPGEARSEMAKLLKVALAAAVVGVALFFWIGANLERFANRFAYPARREVRRLMRSSPRLADLATVFPGAVHALATKRGPADARDKAIGLVEDGAALKSVARVLDLPLWLRRLPPEAFQKKIEDLPNGELFARRVANHQHVVRRVLALGRQFQVQGFFAHLLPGNHAHVIRQTVLMPLAPQRL